MPPTPSAPPSRDEKPERSSSSRGKRWRKLLRFRNSRVAASTKEASTKDTSPASTLPRPLQITITTTENATLQKSSSETSVRNLAAANTSAPSRKPNTIISSNHYQDSPITTSSASQSPNSNRRSGTNTNAPTNAPNTAAIASPHSPLTNRTTSMSSLNTTSNLAMSSGGDSDPPESLSRDSSATGRSGFSVASIGTAGAEAGDKNVAVAKNTSECAM
ncbi:hypothetical protein HK102_011405 [Quaeritorhiza haematococci]|nr:hypothetical protein HK102_011405 [Quaeritorhiza haematococci]